MDFILHEVFPKLQLRLISIGFNECVNGLSESKLIVFDTATGVGLMTKAFQNQSVKLQYRYVLVLDIAIELMLCN